MITIEGFAGTEAHPQVRLELKGLILRDIFAGLAMQGFNANPETFNWRLEQTADAAYRQADAMLEARKEQP